MVNMQILEKFRMINNEKQKQLLKFVSVFFMLVCLLHLNYCPVFVKVTNEFPPSSLNDLSEDDKHMNREDKIDG